MASRPGGGTARRRPSHRLGHGPAFASNWSRGTWLGHPLHAASALVETASALARAAWAGIDPEGFFRRHASDPEPFLLKLPGLGEVLFVSTVDGARDILTAPATLCRAPLPNPIEPVVGQNSLILLSGEAHRRTRSILMPAFRGELMRSYVDLIADATNDEIAALQPGDQLVVRDAAQAITLDVVIRVVFGVTDRARRAEYARVIKELMRSGSAPLMLVPWLRREIAGRGPWARLVGFRAQLDRLLSEQIEERRAGARTRQRCDGADPHRDRRRRQHPAVMTPCVTSCGRCSPRGTKPVRRRWHGRCITSTATTASVHGLSRSWRAQPRRGRLPLCLTSVR